MINPGDPELIEAVSNHVERHVGPIESVWHEIVSDHLHVDLHWVRPGPGRPYHAVVTSGMSERPMNTGPDGAGDRHAELSILLEPDWQLSPEAFRDERHYWPLRLLKLLARYPFEYDTWLGYGHTVATRAPGPAPGQGAVAIQFAHSRACLPFPFGKR